jgi:hypothetical protein
MHHGTESTDPLSPPAVSRRGFLATAAVLPAVAASASAAPESPAADPADAALAGAMTDLIECLELQAALDEEHGRLGVIDGPYDSDEEDDPDEGGEADEDEEEDDDWDLDAADELRWHQLEPNGRRLRRAEDRLTELMEARGVRAVALGPWVFAEKRHALVDLGSDGLHQLVPIVRAEVLALDGIPPPPPPPSRRFEIVTEDGDLLTVDEGPGTVLDDAVKTAEEAIKYIHRYRREPRSLSIREGGRILVEFHSGFWTDEKVVRHD